MTTGRVLEERYVILERIGRGGMGTVYRGEHIRLKKEVAIKVLHARPPSHRRTQRLLSEGRAASSLEHSNIVDVTDFGETRDGMPFLVMELLKGLDLEAVLRRQQLSWGQIVAIMEQVLSGLGAAHRRGVIHRDLKPSNCILRDPPGYQNPCPRVTIVDFGLAKILDEGQDATTSVNKSGTPEYMAPEQLAGHPLDGRADLFAAGALLYRLVTGHDAFMGRDLLELKHQQESFRSRAYELAKCSGVPRAIDPLIDKALSVDRAFRFQSAEEFLVALQTIRNRQLWVRVKRARATLRRLHDRYGVYVYAVAVIVIVSRLLQPGFVEQLMVRADSGVAAALKSTASPTRHPANETGSRATQKKIEVKPESGFEPPDVNASGASGRSISGDDELMEAPEDSARATSAVATPAGPSSRGGSRGRRTGSRAGGKRTVRAPTKIAAEPGERDADLEVEVMRVLSENSDVLNSCRSGFGFGGSISISIATDARGVVERVRVGGLQASGTLADCVQRALERTTWPANRLIDVNSTPASLSLRSSKAR